MGLIYDKVEGKVDVPHRHDYYTVLLVEEAEGKHVIDYQTYSFQRLEVYFVGPGQVHQVAATERPKGWVFTFSRSFLVENNIPESFITNINLFKSFGSAPPLSLDLDTFGRLKRIVKEMELCLPENLTYGSRALGALLQLFLIYCNNSTSMDDQQLDEENAGVCILRDFKSLVESKYQDWHMVKNYSEEIHVSTKYLSQIVKKFTGKSAKEVIQDRIVLEAKRLLLHTDLIINEIAYRLGFEEPLHFSSFFKKNAGISPTGFRDQKKI